MAVSDDRGQAYTLEAITGGLVIVTAILFAFQAIVVVPSTGGTISSEAEADLRLQAQDSLLTIAQNESFGLSEMIRYWDQANQSFVGAKNEKIGYGYDRPPANVGTVLNETFVERGFQYNVDLVYLRPDNASRIGSKTGTLAYVKRGQPGSDSVRASYRVTLFDNQTLTAPSATSRGVQLYQLDTNASNGKDGYYPIPNAVEGPVYNVVEVRLTVW